MDGRRRRRPARDRGGRRGDPVLDVCRPRPLRTARLLRRPAAAGRRGDFLTSPEVGPLFGAVLARFLDAEWERIGRPDPFTVVDAGPARARSPGPCWPPARVRDGAALRRRRGLGGPARPPPGGRRPRRPCCPASRRRRGRRQRAARQPAVPPRRPRRGLARGLRRRRPAARSPRSSRHRSIRVPAVLPATGRTRGAGAVAGRRRGVGRRGPRPRPARLRGRARLRPADDGAARGDAVAGVVAHVPRATSGGPTRWPTQAPRTSRSTSPSTSWRCRRRRPRRPSSWSGGGSTSWSRRDGGRGRRRPRRPTSPRWRCAAGRGSPRRCSIRPGWVGSACSGGMQCADETPAVGSYANAGRPPPDDGTSGRTQVRPRWRARGRRHRRDHRMDHRPPRRAPTRSFVTRSGSRRRPPWPRRRPPSRRPWRPRRWRRRPARHHLPRPLRRRSRRRSRRPSRPPSRRRRPCRG